jgi:MarR family transcriptional regulator, transcriptional regulator for hemolysin
MARVDAAAMARQYRVGFLVHDVSRLRRTVFDKALKPLGITRSQWWVLAHLSRGKEHAMMQTELANVLDIGKVALGGLLDRLEANGYIERRADPVDRRAKRVAITDAGERLLESMQEHANTLNQEMLRGIKDSEIALVEDVLHRMKVKLLDMEVQSKADSQSRAEAQSKLAA